jgi:hypothetical protein
MNIQDIMLRDIADEERKQKRERDERDAATIGDRCGFPWLAVAVWLAVALAGMVTTFMAGMAYQSRRDLKESRDFTARCDRMSREATERARTMSNQELLDATERECATAADR